MKQVICYLLYDDADYAINQDFARMMREKGAKRGFYIQPVLLSQLQIGTSREGIPYCRLDGELAKPDLLLSRQRHSLISKHFEAMGIPVYNSALVCDLCNDKRKTHVFLSGIPMPKTTFLPPTATSPPADTVYPVVLKPACSHGGDRVTLVQDEDEWQIAAASILPEPALQQSLVSDAGCDLRVYIVFGEIIAGVMRTAKEGIVSNFKRGGTVAYHELTADERSLAEEVIQRFEDAGAPLCLAGVDFLYENGRPILGEVEDVVGSRMLYQTSNIDIVSLFLDKLADIYVKQK